MPSISSTSPAKKRPGHFLLSMVFRFTSFRLTPPAVTNSSLKVLLPVTERREEIRISTSLFSCFFERSAQLISSFISAFFRNHFQRREGNSNGENVPMLLRLFSSFFSFRKYRSFS